MKKTLIMSVIAATLSLSATAQAHNHNGHHSVSFDNVTVEYGQSYDNGADFSAFGLSGQRTIGNGVFVEASYAKSDADDFDFKMDQFTLGLGYAYNVNRDTAFYGVLGAAKVDSDDFPAGVDDDGWFASVGVKHMMLNKVELDARITHTDILDREVKAAGLGVKYYVHKDWTVNAGYTFDLNKAGDLNGLSVGVSYHF